MRKSTKSAFHSATYVVSTRCVLAMIIIIVIVFISHSMVSRDVDGIFFYRSDLF